MAPLLKEGGRRYYGQKYYRTKLTLDEEARTLYIRETYNTLVRDFCSLESDNHVSPYGAKRKQQILHLVSERDHSTLLREAKAGLISYRENFLGGCAKPGAPCDLGGITNVSRCMGHLVERPCEHLLLNREKEGIVRRLHKIYLDKQASTEADSLYGRALQAQVESLERAINVFKPL